MMELTPEEMWREHTGKRSVTIGHVAKCAACDDTTSRRLNGTPMHRSCERMLDRLSAQR